MCLVRACSQEEGKERIRTALLSYGIWKPAYSSRIEAVVGNLSIRNLGLDGGEESFQQLAERIDVVYHCGSLVNFILPYRQVTTLVLSMRIFAQSVRHLCLFLLSVHVPSGACSER